MRDTPEVQREEENDMGERSSASFAPLGAGLLFAVLVLLGQGACAAGEVSHGTVAAEQQSAGDRSDQRRQPPDASDADSVPPAEVSEVLHRGRYELTYFGRRLAEETFTIERTPDGGYRIVATFIPRDRDGDQVASTSEYILDAKRRFRRATYRPLDAGNLSATYEAEDGVLVATASDGQVQRVRLDPGDRIAGPHYVTDFFVLHPLGYEVGDAGEFVCHTFGFKDWRVHRCTVKPKRLRNDRKSHPLTDRRVSTIVYRCRIDAGAKDFKTRSYLDADGVAVKISVSAPIGSATIRLEESDES
jgi:hypothetical protein